MNFQRVSESDSSVLKDFIDFCLESKPYTFCLLPTLSARILQIKNYYQHLHSVSQIYVLKKESRVVFLIAVKNTEDIADVEFVYGKPFSVLRDLEEFRRQYFDLYPDLTVFRTILLREYKPDPMFNLIKKRDKKAKFLLDNGEKIVLWYKENGTQT